MMVGARVAIRNPIFSEFRRESVPESKFNVVRVGCIGLAL